MRRTQNRRLADRLLCADIVELIWNDDLGREFHRVGNLEDISPNGFCFQMEVPLKPGTVVSLRYSATGSLTGMVRYSVRRNEAYVLGVELDKNSGWSTADFRPQHLLDPNALEFPQNVIDGCAAAPSTMIH